MIQFKDNHYRFLVVVNFQVIRCLPESRRALHKATKRDQDERETTLISGPEIKIAWMIGDGLEKGFVSWWLGVKKNLEYHAGFTHYHQMGSALPVANAARGLSSSNLHPRSGLEC